MDKIGIGKKTILYLITQSEPGGAQRYLLDLAKNLKNEFDIKVAFGEPGEKGELAGSLDQVGIEYYFLPHLKRAISPINDLLALFEIIKLIKKIKPDIIHLNSSKISILGSLAVKITRFQVHAPRSTLYTVHGWVFNEPLPVWQKLFYKYTEKFTAGWKDKIICVSEFDRQVALKEKIAPPKKLITIHNGIEPINFLSKEKALNIINQKSEISAKGGSASGGKNLKYLVGSIGNLYKTKGYEYLIKAVKILTSNANYPISAVIIGEGKQRKNLEKLIIDLKMKDSVFLLGQVDKAARLLPAFDLYVSSSVKEGLSYTIMEAMQAGLPIVATKVGGNEELITNKNEGLLVPPASPEKLAEAIRRMTNNQNDFGKAAKEKALREFGLDRMINETKRLYC